MIECSLRKSLRAYTCSMCLKKIKNNDCYLHTGLFSNEANKYINIKVCKKCASELVVLTRPTIKILLKNQQEIDNKGINDLFIDFEKVIKDMELPE